MFYNKVRQTLESSVFIYIHPNPRIFRHFWHKLATNFYVLSEEIRSSAEQYGGLWLLTFQDILQELILKLELIKLLLQYTNVFNRIAHFYSSCHSILTFKPLPAFMFLFSALFPFQIMFRAENPQRNRSSIVITLSKSPLYSLYLSPYVVTNVLCTIIPLGMVSSNNPCRFANTLW